MGLERRSEQSRAIHKGERIMDIELAQALKEIADLKKENAELKETVTKMNNVITETFSNLTKAKNVIKKFYDFVNNGVEYDPEHPQEYIDLWNKLCAEAEQFLK